MNGLINTQTEIYSLRRSGDCVLLCKCVYLTCKHNIIYVHIMYIKEKKPKILFPATLYL